MWSQVESSEHRYVTSDSYNHIQRWSGLHMDTLFYNWEGKKCPMSTLMGPPAQVTLSKKQQEATTGKTDSWVHEKAVRLPLEHCHVNMCLGTRTTAYCQLKQHMFVDKLSVLRDFAAKSSDFLSEVERHCWTSMSSPLVIGPTWTWTNVNARCKMHHRGDW